MSKLKEEITAHERMCNDLEIEHFGKWVIVYNKEFAGTYGSFQAVA